jgi:hypothetical protein
MTTAIVLAGRPSSVGAMTGPIVKEGSACGDGDHGLVERDAGQGVDVDRRCHSGFYA